MSGKIVNINFLQPLSEISTGFCIYKTHEMTKFESLVHLVYSMTISEKKAFRKKNFQKKYLPDYLMLYDSIELEQGKSIAQLRGIFMEKCPDAAFETTVKYLFEIILNTLMELRKNQDSFYSLFNKILKARILFEKSLFDECFDLLKNVMVQAEKYENYYALLLANRLELEYLLALNFPDIDEQQLLKKQFKLNESVKFIRKINEQSSLYEILKHRVVKKGYARSLKEKNDLNDLVYSELSLVATLSPENFEISKLHQLFQSNYLISVGDYKSALRSYYELNNLFEANKHLWSKPPVYYLHTLEGVLESLRGIHNYNGMSYFIDQLKKIESPSIDFKIHLTCITFLYELFPHLDNGDFQSSAELMNNYKESLFDKFSLLNRARQAELCLYTSLIFFGESKYQKAHKFLSQIIITGKSYFYLPLYRTIRLVNLMILYKLGDEELIRYEIRSMKRDLSGNEKGYKIERFMFKFLVKHLPGTGLKKEKLFEKYQPEMHYIRNDVFELQVLRIFDFTAWMESLLTQHPLQEILKQRHKEALLPE